MQGLHIKYGRSHYTPPPPFLHQQIILTTVKSSNGLASSIFFSVFSKSASSASTLPFVANAFWTAWASNASIVLICFATSTATGLNAR